MGAASSSAARVEQETTGGRGAVVTAVPGTGERPPLERAEPRVVEVRRNAVLAGLVGVASAAVAIAYLGRAAASGAPLDWTLTLVTGIFAVAWLWSLLDARHPLLVADAHGVRVRLGRTWEGVSWRALDRIEHHPRRGPGRDGRLVLVPEATTPMLEGLDRGGRQQAAISRRLHGAPFAVPLGLGTRLSGVRADELVDVLRDLAGDDRKVVETLPEPRVTTEPAAAAGPADDLRHDDEFEDEAYYLDETGEIATVDARPRRGQALRLRLGALIGSLADRGRRERTDEQHDERDESDPDAHLDAHPDAQPGDLVGEETVELDRASLAAEVEALAEVSETPEPARERRLAARTEVQREHSTGSPLPEAAVLRRGHGDGLGVHLDGDDTEVWGAGVRPIARPGEAVEPLVLDDFATEPAPDPVIGPELAAARTRLSLSIDQLADRTRIRPHVLEAIEVDDFTPCGGDFYARGHLRTLARVLGVDAGPLVTAYDERYADAPIDPRRVFAAELATGASGSIRGTRGGPSWTVLVAAVMVVVLAWSVARLVMDDPAPIEQAPPLNGSGGLPAPAGVADPVPMVVTAVQGGATVTIRDGEGEIRYSGDLAMGESAELEISPPVRIEASDGGAIETVLDGQNTGRLGEAGQPASDTLVPR